MPLKTPRYKVKNKSTTSQVNYIQKLYAELYRARNDFLHGNPVTAGNLFPAKDRSQPVLLHCAPLIYRAALAAFFRIRQPKILSGRRLQNSFAASLDYSAKQGVYEDAVRACQTRQHPQPS